MTEPIHDVEVETLPEVVQPTALMSFKPVDLADLKEHTQAIDQAKREVMESGRDYMLIPNTNKPSLLKPGAEKLLKLYNAGVRFENVEVVEDHDKEYKHGRYGNTATGWYFYRVKATIFHQPTGTVMGDCEGSCSSNERGGQPANTILKMAQKSAMVGAVLFTMNASDLFTQDVEDLPKQNNNQPQKSNTNKGMSRPDNIKGMSRTMFSKYGTESKKSLCKFCNNHHILEGDAIGEADGKWGAVNCFRQQQMSDELKADGGPREVPVLDSVDDYSPF
jgi:hypothetical protein